METRTNRFSDKTFLQNLGIGTIQNIVSFLFQGTLRVFLRYCIFAGVLGSFWVMAIIEPDGNLYIYLIPALFLAIPLAFLSDHNTTWEKVFSGILWLTIMGGIFGVISQIYKGLGSHTGQLIFFVPVGLTFALFSGSFIFRKRSSRGSERRGGVIRVLWAVGVLYLPVLILTIFYYNLWHQDNLETSASILFCVLAFLICLTLALIRIFWMDALRNYRAMRVGEYPSEDSVNFLELLIPRSMFLVVMVPCLLFSEAVMFSVVYRVTKTSESKLPQSKETTVTSALADKSATSKPKATKPAKETRKTPPAAKKKPTQTAVGQASKSSPSSPRAPPAKVDGGYRFLAWLNFSIRPYVFPKNSDGTEVKAPAWIKPFGRILLSLIILLLFTHQLNIWTQYKNCYLSLYNLTREGAGAPDAPPELAHQWKEVELYIQALLKNYGGFWRVIMMYAMTSPNDGLLWKWFVDPGTAFLETVDRIYRYCKYHWDAAVFGGFALLTIITSPFAIIYEVPLAYLFCAVPSLLVGIALFVTSRWYNPHPPRIQSWLLPWLYPSHLVLSLIYFFVALSVHNVSHVSLQVLFVLNITILVIYPVLYWFSGERMMHPDENNIRKTKWKNSRQVRLAFLRQFFAIEHRVWVLDALVYRIHPGRSRVMSARYMGPSIQLGFFKWLRAKIERVEDMRSLVFGSLNLSLVVSVIYFAALTFITLLVVSYNTTKDVGTILSQVGLTWLAAHTPLAVVGLASLISNWRGKEIYNRNIPPKRLFWGFATLTLIPSLSVVWIYQTHGWLQRFLLLTVSWLLIFPWLAYLSWRHLSSETESETDTTDTSTNHVDKKEKKKKASRLNQWIEALHRQESNALGRVYNRVHMWGRTDAYARNVICEGLVEVIERTQHALRSEKWFREEARELDRVTHLWFGEGSIVAPEDLTKPAAELARLNNQAIDVLGSVLHDQFNVERRSMLAPYNPPNLKLVFTCLERILRLSRPTPFKRDRRGTPPSALEEMHLILRDLEELLKDFVVESFQPNEDSLLDTELCLEYRADIFRILRLLDSAYDLEWIHAQTTPETNPDDSDEDWVTEAVTSSVSAVWGRTEKLMRLPTPLARRYGEIHQIRQEIDQLLEEQDELYIPPMQLHREQAHHSLQDYRREQVLTQRLNECRQALWNAQRRLYQELLGYILTGLKTHLLFERANEQWLNLHWQTAEEQADTFDWLSNGSNFSPEMTFWVELYKEVYNEKLSKEFSYHMLEEEPLNDALETLETLLLKVCDALTHNAPLIQYLDVAIPRPDQEKLKLTVEVLFEGQHPSIAFVEGTAQEHETSDILKGGTLLWTGKQSRDFRQLEYWIAQWLLELIWQASRAWEMWVPKNAMEDHLDYRQKNLDDLKQVLSDLGSLLPVASRQEQEVIDNYFSLIDRRIQLLEDNLHKSDDQTPLETGYAFFDSLRTVRNRLQEMEWLGEMRMAQLLHAGLLPQSDFQYLSDVIFSIDGGETLLRYQNGDGSLDTFLPLPKGHNASQLVSAQAPWLHDFSSLPDRPHDSMESTPPPAWDVEEPLPHDTPPPATLQSA